MNNTEITINKEQRLYVIHTGNGYSTLGFDVCYNRATRLLAELKQETEKRLLNDLKLAEPGTPELYRQYQYLTGIAKDKNKMLGWRSKSELIPEFIGKEGYRVEIVDRDGEKRRFIIGKSTGFIPCHLEIKKSNSSGGMSVMGYPFQSVRFIEKAR